MKYFVSFCIIFFLFTVSILAQSLDEAKKLYLEGKYAEAIPAFEKAVTSSPRNASYNQWYGNSLLETGNPAKAKEYLTFAASRKITEAYRSLGKMHYLLYEFEESAEAYSQYADLLLKEKKAEESELVKPLIQRSERAARMLSRCEDIQIIDSIVLDKSNFLEAYFLSMESGSLQNINNQVIYENPLKDKRYFAEKNEDGNYHLYSEFKLQNNWGDKKRLDLPADSLTNDNYPFILQDGLTIYYASTGNSSIGGYDLFITRYNMNNDTYLNPNQMGMPFNSIANDYMMAVDEINNIAYFATDRFQPEDKVVVYTFIPNEEFIPVETEEDLIARAKITSIKNSWKSDVDYEAYIESVRNRILNETPKIAKDFSFVINDNIVYYTLSDFESDAAKQTYLQAKELEEQIKVLEEDLGLLRRDYGRLNNSQKQQLKNDILSKENRLFSLLSQHEQAKINTRNLEIKYLRK